MGSPQQGRREDLRVAEDVQARETRRRLAAAYRAAAAQQLTRPSVTWICAHSEVARSTFYTHFATIDDLAVHTITEAFTVVSDGDVARRTAQEEDRRTISRAGLLRTVEALVQTREVLEYAISVGSRAAVLERLVAQFATFARPSIATEYVDLDVEALDLVTEFVSAGTVHAVMRWMQHRTASREELVDQLVDVLPPRLTRA